MRELWSYFFSWTAPRSEACVIGSVPDLDDSPSTPLFCTSQQLPRTRRVVKVWRGNTADLAVHSFQNGVLLAAVRAGATG